MKRIAATLIWVFFMVSFLTQAYGSETGPLLDRLVQQALENNPGLRAQRMKVEASRTRPSQARALPDPVADVQFMSLSVDRFDASDALSRGITVGVTQGLPYPGKRGLREEAAEKEIEVEQAKLRSLESRLRGEVLAAAYGYALLDGLLEINGRTAEALDAASRSAAGVYASGAGSQAEVLRAQTAHTRKSAEREELLKRRAIAEARLESLLGGPAEPELLAGLELQEPHDVEPLSELLERLPDSAPEVLEGTARESVRESKVEVARKDFRPDFRVGARYHYRDMSRNGGDYVSVMVGMTLPFFNRKTRYLPALQEAVTLRESARYESENALLKSRFELEMAHEGASRDLRVYHLYRDGLLLQARQAFDSTRAAYGVGKEDLTALLMALTNYYEAERDTLSALYGYWEAIARMETVLGSPSQESPTEDPS